VLNSARGESQASPLHLSLGVVCLVSSFTCIAIFGQPFYGDMRNLDDAHSKTHFSSLAIRSLEEWNARRIQIRRQILVSAGLLPYPERNPLNARRTSRRYHHSYYVEKVVIQPRLGFFVSGNLYMPVSASVSAKVPGVLVPHGHWKAGRAHQTESYSVPALCENLAAQGYAAFAYDMIGYSDTRQLPHNFGDSAAEYEWSYGPMGQQLWDSIRGLDFLESIPEIDSNRLAATGSSGGGTQTFLLAAVDDRLKVAAPVDMVSATFQGDDACETAAGLRVGTNNMEFAAMMAPRPMILVSSTRDWTRRTPVEEFPSIQSVYALYGRPDLVKFAQVDAEHNFNRASREAVYAFFAEHLKYAAQAQVPETVADLHPAEELLFGDKPEHLIGAPAQDQLFAAWREAAEKQTESLSRSELRDRLRITLGVEWPAQVEALPTPERILLARGHGERVPSQWFPGTSDATTLVVHPDGSDAARKTPFVTNLQAAGVPVLLLDVYQTGAASAPVPLQFGDRLVFHRTDDAYRIQDIITGLRWLHDRSPDLRLHCTGRASSWCLLAAAVVPFPVSLDIEPIRVPANDVELRRLVNIPGLQRAGGFKVARSLLEVSPEQAPLITDSLGTHN
jgi:dienelactone hydrolase